MTTRRMTTALVVLLASSVAWAAPTRAGRDGDRRTMSPERHERVLRKIHTFRLVELGQVLGLDTAGTLKLGERLAPFERQRVQLRLENLKASEELRRARRGESGADAVRAAKQLVANQVKLAELDQRELDEVLKGLSADQAAKAALFLAHFQRRVERMAGELRKSREGRRGD